MAHKKEISEPGAKRPGYLVTTKTGLQGRTYHSDALVNGKQLVYVELETGGYRVAGMLCDPGTLKVNGFID